jgi:hypothetical protein
MNLHGKLWIEIGRFCLIALAVSCGPQLCHAFDGGTGEPNDPYLISMPEQLLSMASDPNCLQAHYMLTGDLDFSPMVYTGPLVQAVFQGVLDGGEHVIRNLVIDADDLDHVGLFAQVGAHGVIRSLRLENVVVRGSACVGAMVSISEGLVEDCHVTGDISGKEVVGGLVGSQLGAMANCSACVTAIGGSSIGALCGVNAGIVGSCHADGSVCGEVSVGGLLGAHLHTVAYSSFTGEVSGANDVGGLVGQSFGTIQACRSRGSVYGEWRVGGLVGYQEGMITHCYSEGRTGGQTDVGGLVGKVFSGLIAYSYANGLVTGQDSCGGLVGSDYEGAAYLSYWDIHASGIILSAVGLGKTTAAMMAPGNFRGWGSEGLWALDPENDYPRLIWEQTGAIPIVDANRTYGGGTGQPSDRYRMTTIEDFVGLGYYPQDWSKYFILTQDLDARTIDSSAFVPVGRVDLPFTGALDGNDHRISGVEFADTTQPWVGLFGVVGAAGVGSGQDNGLVENLCLCDVSVAGRDGAAGLAGLNRGEIHCCVLESGSISGRDEVGGLVGRNEGGIVQSGARAMVGGSGICVGGLVGCNQGCVLQCWADPQVNAEQEHASDLIGCDWSRDNGLDCENATTENTLSDCQADFKDLGILIRHWLADGSHASGVDPSGQNENP